MKCERVKIEFETVTIPFMGQMMKHEIARILRHAADRMECDPPRLPFTLRDYNGNKVGTLITK